MAMDQTLYAIQQKLKTLGQDPGPLDGIWGDKTRDAIAQQLGIGRVINPGSAMVEAPWFDLAMKEIGTKEVPGPGSNPDVVEYLTEASGVAYGDEVPWCAALVGAMLKRAGYKPSGSLMARSYIDWGTVIDKPRKGCIVVLKRGAPPAGHVGFANDWTGSTIQLLGGNQADKVSLSNFSRASVLAYRWPKETL
jgi:uncharacterized protein (TIGR02594 family)